MIIFIRAYHDREQTEYGPFGKHYRPMSTAKFSKEKEDKLIKEGYARKIKKTRLPRQVKDDQPDNNIETKKK